MATQNVVVEKGGWQDVLTIGSLTLTENDAYTISVKASGENEVCISDTTPYESLEGHPVTRKDNFTFTYKGEGIWVRLNPMAETTAKVVIS